MRIGRNRRKMLSRAPAKPGAAFKKKRRRNSEQRFFEGKWKQIRGEAKEWWGKLTDDDLDRAARKYDVMVGILQEKAARQPRGRLTKSKSA